MDTTTESVTPHSTPEADPIAAGIDVAEQSQLTSPAEVNKLRERQAFETYVASHGEAIPDNFKDAGSWFDSLKEAQKQYTQGQQEISDLRSQYAEQGTQNPAYKEATPAAEGAPSEPQLTDELRIPPAKEVVEEVPEPIGVSEESYDAWAREFAATGEFSDNTKNQIKQKTGFTDRMLNDYEEAQKAKLRESYGRAANHVGGQDRLDKIFKWASSNLSEQDQQSVNLGLSSPTYEVTLRGLAAMYDAKVTSDKTKEPAPNPNLTQVAASETGILPYRTKREFNADRNNPQFNTEPRFRQAVEQRMSITNWNTLPV
jgi:hypothetical protein